MKVDYEIKWTPKDIETKLAAHKEIVVEEEKKMLQKLVDIAVKVAQSVVPKYTRGLSDSIKPGHKDSLTEVSDGKAIIGTKHYNAGWVSFGQKPKWVPAKAIRDWASAKGLSGNIDSVTYFVQRKIAKEGIKGKNFLWAGRQEAMQKAQQFADEMANKLLERLGLK